MQYNLVKGQLHLVKWMDKINVKTHLELDKIQLRSFLVLLEFLSFVIELLIVHGSLLVLLVLGDQVVHVGLRLSELHLVHALPGIPVEESLRFSDGKYEEEEQYH